MVQLRFLWVFVLLLIAAPVIAQRDDIVIEWWSPWADDPIRKAVIERIALEYEQQAPDNVSVRLDFWDNDALFNTLPEFLETGVGAPDIVGFDPQNSSWAADDWLLNLERYVDVGAFTDAGLDTFRYEGIEGTFFISLGLDLDVLLYDPAIFEELGIRPAEPLDIESFLQIAATCAEAGVSGAAQPASADAVLLPLWSRVGPADYRALVSGSADWLTPAAGEWMAAVTALSETGFWPGQPVERSCFQITSTRHATQQFPPDRRDWPYDMLAYPAWAEGESVLRARAELGFAIPSNALFADEAGSLLAFMAQPRYGALWAASTGSPSTIPVDRASDWPGTQFQNSVGVFPGAWDTYWDRYDAVYADLPVEAVDPRPCVSQNEALTSVLEAGITDADAALQTLNNARCFN